MGRTFPLLECLPSLVGGALVAGRTLPVVLWMALFVVVSSPVPAVAGKGSSGRACAGQAATAQTAAAARRLLYPRWDPASGLAGEPFRSSSLGMEAADMRLADFQVAAVPDSAHRARFVAAALLEPQGFPVPYTLLEVAVMERGDTGLRLIDNLKVRVDSGSGPGGLRMALPPPGRQTAQALRFEVGVTDAVDSLRHRFRHDRDGIALLESIIAR